MLIGSLLSAIGAMTGVPTAVWLPVAVLAAVGMMTVRMRRRR